MSCLLVCCWPATLVGGNAGSSDNVAAGRSDASYIEESRPSIYYLPDKDGNLQSVLGFKYQDFLELYNLKNQLGRPDQPPRLSIERILAVGAAGQTHAELSIQFQVLVRDDGWVRVPLRLDQGFLRGPVQYKGPGEQIVDFEGERAGYVCWLRGKPDTRHEITLTMLVPLEIVGPQSRLKLSFPRAAAAEMKLSVPLGAATGSVSQGATLLPPAATAGTAGSSNSVAAAGATEFAIVGLPADFQLAWRKSKPQSDEAAPVLEASGTVLARLDERGISTDATLSVRSLTAAMDGFVVRLPPDAKLLPGNAVEQSGNPPHDVEVVEQVGNPPLPAQRLVEVRLAKRTTGPVEVRLSCRRECDPSRHGSWCELAGFEVIGAARQWGAVAVAAGDDWQVFFGPSRQTRPLDPLPDALHKDNVVAGFEYFGQPYCLPVRLAARRARLGVDPQYVLLVDRDQVRLEGKLMYTIGGAKLSTLDLAIPGWELDEVGPGSLVGVDGVGQVANLPRGVTVDAGEVSIPLLRPSLGSVEVRLRAHRAIPPGTTSLALPLPQPRAGSVAPASVAVVPADNVELNPDGRMTEGLEAAEAAPAMKLPAREQAPLCYRGTGGRAVFAARFRVLPPRIETNSPAGSTIVDRAWIQSWLTAASREDRAALQLTTDRGHLEVLLPDDAAADQADVLVDGRHVKPRLAAENRLLIPLPHAERAEYIRRHVVELRYHFRGPRPAGGWLPLEFPRLNADVWTRRIYWQLVLPANEHLIANPDGLTGEFVWGWDGYFWGRNPLLDETELESWVGAAPRGPLPDRANRYLFSTLGRLERAEVRTAGRTWIVLLASGAVLAAGLLLIRVPASRHPATLLALAVGLLAAGLIAPEPTLLLAQAASLGLPLVLLAGFLERGAARRRRSAAPKEPSGSRIELGSSRAVAAPLAAANPSSTETLPPSEPQSPGDIE